MIWLVGGSDNVTSVNFGPSKKILTNEAGRKQKSPYVVYWGVHTWMLKSV